MLRTRFLTVAITLLFGSLWAQDTLSLSYESYILWVQKNHPLLKNSQWEKNIAQNNILKARALLEPVLSGKLAEKKIDNQLYYYQQNLELYLPTWYGIDFHVQHENLSGNRLNAEETKGKLNTFGISVPLGRDLIYNKRRTAVQQAKILNQMTESEQEMLRNEILLEANFLFWDWVKNYEILALSEKVLDVNRKRYQLVKKSYELGERPAIDTTEAYAQLQSFMVKNTEIKNSYTVATWELSQFLWDENGKAYNLPTFIKPDEELSTQFTKDYALITSRMLANINHHNALQYYQQKNSLLEAERKLKWQNFLPKLDFTYNFYSKDPKKTALIPFFENNYQYGIKLEMPLYMRAARAEYENVKLKILQNNEALKYKKQELLAKISSYDAELHNYWAITENTEQLEQNFQKLLRAEEIRFSNGESSLFLINSRENKLLETQEKLIELKAKTIKTYFKINWLENNIFAK